MYLFVQQKYKITKSGTKNFTSKYKVKVKNLPFPYLLPSAFYLGYPFEKWLENFSLHTNTYKLENFCRKSHFTSVRQGLSMLAIGWLGREGTEWKMVLLDQNRRQLLVHTLLIQCLEFFWGERPWKKGNFLSSNCLSRARLGIGEFHYCGIFEFFKVPFN